MCADLCIFLFYSVSDRSQKRGFKPLKRQRVKFTSLRFFDLKLVLDTVNPQTNNMLCLYWYHRSVLTSVCRWVTNALISIDTLVTSFLIPPSRYALPPSPYPYPRTVLVPPPSSTGSSSPPAESAPPSSLLPGAGAGAAVYQAYKSRTAH